MPNATSVTLKDSNDQPQTVSTTDALMALVGEVQTTPTANTVLDRLKAIATAIAANVIGTGSPSAPSSAYLSTVPADGAYTAPVPMTALGTAFTLTMAPYESAMLQVTCSDQFLFGGLIQVSGSVDGTNFVDIVATDADISGFGSVSPIFAAGMYEIRGAYRFLKVDVTNYVSGTIEISAVQRKSPLPPNAVAITGNTQVRLQGVTSDPNAGIAPSASQALASSRVFKASSGNAYKINVHNTNAADRYAFLLNLAAAPANGTISAAVMDVKKVPAGGDAGWDFTGMPPMGFSAGICVVLSSTQFPTLTLAADGVFSGMVA